MRIVVTGGSGKGGAWVVRDLREHGHDVLNVDVRHDGSAFGLCLLADLTDLGQTQEALAGADAVVHFAAIPAPELRSGRRDVPDQRDVDLQRLRRRRGARHQARRLGVERDRARPAVRHAAAVRARSTRRSSRDRRRRTRCRSSSARRWRRSSPGGQTRPSSGCGSRTSWSRRTTRSSRATGTTRGCGSGTCGATSTRATSRRRAASAWRPRSTAPRSASSPPPTRS